MNVEVFFYGLFMDVNVLRKKDINPLNPRKGMLNDYTLKIGQRASLIPSPGDRSYGMVMTVDEIQLKNLYNEASVVDYSPEDVRIITETNESVCAVCYNLPAQSLSGTNQSYAHALYTLASQLKFPGEYLEKIKVMAFSGKE